MPYKNKEDRINGQKKYRERTRASMLEYLKDHPCEICGESDPVVLEFDHVDRNNKTTSVSKLMSGHRSWSTILIEIEKCRVLCANCHRRHTYKQLGHWGRG